MDPWVSLAALSLTLSSGPVMPSLDPGPSPLCPDDMRLVEGPHYENTAHVCVDERIGAQRERSHLHCYRYAEDVTALEGPVTNIRVCMDQFEAPNVRGAKPLVMQSFESASRWCERRKKRLCTEQEWELACEGPNHRPLSYGWAVNVKLCNSNRRWKPVDFEAFGRSREDALAESNRLWQGTPSGFYKTCVSSFGIFDQMGNVEEWVIARKERKVPGALMGGFWAKPWTGCRGTNDAHEPTFAFYETGFRCCQDPLEVDDHPAQAAPDE